MERQRIDVTNSELKFGVEARTSIFGIIDPIKKRYDSSKTVGENVNASQQLLSKFHMVFLMLDNPNPVIPNFCNNFSIRLEHLNFILEAQLDNEAFL